MTLRALAGVLFATAAGCTSLSDVECVSSDGGQYFPLAVGNWWRYQVEYTDPSPDTEKTWFVIDELPGEVFEIRKIDNEPDRSWTRRIGDRYEWRAKLWLDSSVGQNFVPSALRFDGSAEHLCKGDSWTEEYVRREYQIGVDCSEQAWLASWQHEGASSCPYSDISVRERWTVTDVARTVRTPAGDISGCLCERREVLEGGAKVGEYCYARGVGKVSEDSQTEQEGLIEACVGGRDLRGQDCGRCPPACVPEEACECPAPS